MADGSAAPEMEAPIMRKRTGKTTSFSLTVEEFKQLYDGRYQAGIEFFGSKDTEFKRPFARMTMKQVEASMSKASLLEGRFVEGKETDRSFWVSVPEGYWVCSIPPAARKR